MERIAPTSKRAGSALELVGDLQRRLVQGLIDATTRVGYQESFAPIEWFRDAGRHGGGVRYAVSESPAFNRGSVNLSCVHYDDLPDKRLSSATALSTIIHPRHPRAPSMHMHISWTEMRPQTRGADPEGYWRIMGDLNPSLEAPEATQAFAAAMRQAAPALYAEAAAQGDAYFYIPVLDRHRGATHFYLEGYSTGNFDADRAVAEGFGRAVIDCYCRLTEAALADAGEPTAKEREAQLGYHTLYLLQVLTLDRGTTSGLLIHDQNDVGILASLPSHVDRALLESWIGKMPAPQDQLLRGIVDRLPDQQPAHVDDQTRAELASWVRAHYRAHPGALAMQARGNTVPPTVDNHR